MPNYASVISKCDSLKKEIEEVNENANEGITKVGGMLDGFRSAYSNDMYLISNFIGKISHRKFSHVVKDGLQNLREKEYLAPLHDYKVSTHWSKTRGFKLNIFVVTAKFKVGESRDAMISRRFTVRERKLIDVLKIVNKFYVEIKTFLEK